MTADNCQRQSTLQISGNQCIRFGTDGWRGIIAEDFTFKNVSIVAQAIADYIKNKEIQNTLPTSHLPLSAVIVGYDNRFLSDKFAKQVAKVISANNIDVHISKTAVTSPSISLFCKKNNCIGIMITASHNPPFWNGLKIKLPYGGSVSQKIINEISACLYKNDVKIDDKKIDTVDVIADYKAYLKSLVKVSLSSKLNVVVDSMYGSGSGIIEQLFDKKNKIHSINNYREPLFGGINPEPIEKNLYKLKKEILKNKAAAGFAFDGDADRLGVIDDKGRYLSPHIVFPLILLYILEHKKLKGKIVQTVSLGYLSERIAKKFSQPFEEVSVGFKYICEKMLDKDVLFGGEESGGYGWGKGMPERDGILNALLIMEMLTNTKKKLSYLVDDLQKRFGKSCFLRKDIKLKSPVDKEKFTKSVNEIMCKNTDVREIKAFDGIKIIFNNDDWLLLRPSGTEPVLRTYSETNSIVKTKILLDFAEKICFNLVKHE
ncbi:MAG: phosphoglucomutase/phosphomannomutase family protein [Elusimicrobia bacterium]|nr:phosphoglucomutase/phosphomannomutase family protein [Elusimicrobiota bacterium]